MATYSGARAHRAVADEAGLRSISLISVLAGIVTAYGTFAIVASIVGAVLSSLDVQTDFRTNDWTGSGAVAALATAVSLFVAYLFGGYVAGRMARRKALLHGVAVFVASLVIAVVVGGVVGWLTDDQQIRESLQSIGVPTTTDQISGVAVVGAIVSIAAILVGSILGAMLGERWHTKLSQRVVDPDIGATRVRRERAAAEDGAAQEQVDRDEVIRRDREADRVPVAGEPVLDHNETVERDGGRGPVVGEPVLDHDDTVERDADRGPVVGEPVLDHNDTVERDDDLARDDDLGRRDEDRQDADPRDDDRATTRSAFQSSPSRRR
jgi:hypothetical protein